MRSEGYGTYIVCMCHYTLQFFNADGVLQLINSYELNEEYVSKKCSYAHRIDIAEFVSWSEVGPRLKEIGELDMNDIKIEKCGEKEKRMKLLHLWAERNGSNATYGAIITAMLKARKMDEAEGVCEVLKRGKHFP